MTIKHIIRNQKKNIVTFYKIFEGRLRQEFSIQKIKKGTAVLLIQISLLLSVTNIVLAGQQCKKMLALVIFR